MKNYNLYFNLSLALALLITALSCQPTTFEGPIDPGTQPSELSQALLLDGDNLSGEMPATTGAANSPEINHYQSSASVANDNILYIPLNISTQQAVERVYLQVTGADNYWALPAAVSPGQDNHVFQMGIPKRILEGQFELGIAVADQSGKISPTAFMAIQIEAPLRICQDGTAPPEISGTDGLTIKRLYFGDQPGVVTISYQMYQKPDRMDIFYDGQWATGTGNRVEVGSNIPASQCYDGTEGYVAGVNELSFFYDPAKSTHVDIYLSGCFGGTEWDFRVKCPEDWFGDLPDCPCHYDSSIDERVENGGQWADCGEASQVFHFGAAHEIRWFREGTSGPGQQCTYNAEGILITNGIAAGSPDIVSPEMCGSGLDWLDELSVNYLCEYSDHCLQDVRPWETIPCWEYLDLWKANQGANNCGGVTVSGIGHMLNLVGNLTCKEITVMMQEAIESEEASNYLTDFLLGTNTLFDKDVLRSDLQEWKATVCDDDDDLLCIALNGALQNLED
mgnify:CR=1 FL=1